MKNGSITGNGNKQKGNHTGLPLRDIAPNNGRLMRNKT
jgi:hypothetical protein